MRNLHKVLIGSFAHVAVLFLRIIFPNAQHADTLFDQQINNLLAGSVHILIYTPVSRVRQALHLSACAFASKLAL